jgi:uncharacterized protein
MADWSKILSKGRVEDRRAMGPAQIGGGLGITGIAILLLMNYLGGGKVGDVLPQVLNQLQNTQVVQEQNFDTRAFEGADSYEVFVSTVLGSTNDMWTQIFNQNNLDYTPPTLVLFRTATDSACGGASSDVGPHYCPLDQTIYLDETFFDELTRRFGGNSGDVAQAYVIAHEAGHHAQNVLGILKENGEVNGGENMDPQDQSIALELEADCFAGLWAYSVRDKGVFLPGEINEALDAASAVGDDRIQQNIEGRINPETWTHGSSADRVRWFNTGFNSGKLEACDTFGQ